MPNGLVSANGYSGDEEELLQLEKICRELRKEKEMLQELLLHERSINAELIKRFESDAIVVSEARSRDKKYIDELERKLRNCSQEIGFLQDQLNLRSTEVTYLGEQVHSLELKVGEASKLHEEISLLKEEVAQYDSQQTFFMFELEQKEAELLKSRQQISNLEAVMSSDTLEYQCEIETMKLEILSLEQRCCIAEKLCEQATQEKTRMDALFEEHGVHVEGTQHTINCLEKENEESCGKLRTIEGKTEIPLWKAQTQHNEWMNNCWTTMPVSRRSDKDLLLKPTDSLCSPNDSGSNLLFSPQHCRLVLPSFSQAVTYEEVSNPFLSKLVLPTAWDNCVKDEMERMSIQIRESDQLIGQLKDELREVKLRAKEEAEDLAQEMAELRYQTMGMLEEECKRRACIEEASIRRIQELEAQVSNEKSQSVLATKNSHDVEEQAEARSTEIQRLQDACGECILHTQPMG
ncbi:unnamed protein product [Spirodela intermedia]|uniref:Uncharacterized protein n=1 Tax=Spirodela intermedia TaxID=51605 RepID=A0A7I8KQY6_SPIIN|nr:unnamed protein product [Spirodela intermedia]